MDIVEDLGGEKELRALVDRFYDLIETLDEAKDLHRLHFRGFGMEHVRTEQFNFLCGFLGGRKYYLEKHGHMNLRDMHAHVPIRKEDALTWLSVFDQALADRNLEGEHIVHMQTALRRVAMMLINDVEDWRQAELISKNEKPGL